MNEAQAKAVANEIGAQSAIAATVDVTNEAHVCLMLSITLGLVI